MSDVGAFSLRTAHKHTHTQEIINNVCEHTHTAKNCSRKFRCLRFFLCAWTNCRRSTCAHVRTCSFAHRPARKVRVRSSVRACVRACAGVVWTQKAPNRLSPAACTNTHTHTHTHRPRATPPKLQAEPGLAHPRRNISYMHTHSHSHTHNARLSNTHIPFASL